MKALFQTSICTYKVIHHTNGETSEVVPLHWHRETEIIHIYKGNMTCTVNSTCFELKEGDVAVFPANSVHSTVSAEHSIVDVLRFNPDLLKIFHLSAAFSEFHLPLALQKELSIDEEIAHCFHSLATKKQNGANSQFGQILIQLEILKIWTLFVQALHKQSTLFLQTTNGETQERFSQILRYIEEHYSQNISLEDIASLMHYTPSYTSKIFKEHIGISFKKYLLSFRVKKACNELLHTTDNITQIAIRCGFESSRTFNETFRKIMNCSPMEFRRKTFEQTPIHEDVIAEQ